MKSTFKKIAAIIAVAVMTCSIYSCSSDTDNKKSSSETADVTTAGTDEVSTDATGSGSDKDSSVSDPGASDSDTDKIDPDSLIYDFTGLKSEKYAKILTGDRYKLVFKVNNMDIEVYQDIKQKKYLINQSMGEKSMSGVITDGKMYTMSSGKYCSEGEDTNGMAEENHYNGLGFIQSGEEEKDGTTYYYDEFYSSELDIKTKIYVDKEGKIYSIEDGTDGEMLISELTDEFEDSVFNVLDNCTEASEEEVVALINGTGTDEIPS